jgi:hypothetical protein
VDNSTVEIGLRGLCVRVSNQVPGEQAMSGRGLSGGLLV